MVNTRIRWKHIWLYNYYYKDENNKHKYLTIIRNYKFAIYGTYDEINEIIKQEEKFQNKKGTRQDLYFSIKDILTHIETFEDNRKNYNYEINIVE